MIDERSQSTMFLCLLTLHFTQRSLDTCDANNVTSGKILPLIVANK